MPEFYKRQTNPVNQIYRRVVSRVGRHRVHLANDRPLVSFSFDDFPESALRHGREIIEAWGGAATYYLAGRDDRPGVDVPSQHLARELRELVGAGHELACHTASHMDCALAEDAEILADVEANQILVSGIIPGYILSNFAYPYGNISIDSKALLARRFRSCRGIHAGINRGVADLGNLKAYKLYGPRAELSALMGLIDRNVSLCGWLIFFTHDLGTAPSEYGTELSLFAKVVRYAARENSLLTVDAALDCAGVSRDSAAVCGVE